jgi:Zn-dependent protease
MNFLIFLVCALPFHPAIGWMKAEPVNGEWSTLVLFMGAFGWLQMLAVLFNLVPVPGLDGFGVIFPYLDRNAQETFSSPQVRQTAMLVWFLVIWHVPQASQIFHNIIERMMYGLGFQYEEVSFFIKAFNAALFGQPA